MHIRHCHICIYIHIYTHVCVCMPGEHHEHMCTHMFVYTCTHIHTHTPVCVCCVYASMHCNSCNSVVCMHYNSIPGQHHGSAEVGDFKDAIVGDEDVGACSRREIFLVVFLKNLTIQCPSILTI